jgi:hypothetical protein
MVAPAVCTKSTKFPSVHFAAFASELVLLHGIHYIVLYVQKEIGRFCASLDFGKNGKHLCE